MVSFTLFVSKATTGKLLCKVQPAFTIGLDPKDLILLQEIPKFFGEVGKIHTRKDVSGVQYVISSVKDLTNHIIPHFDTYPLCYQKKADQPARSIYPSPPVVVMGAGSPARRDAYILTAQDMNYLKK
jgi:hypothetical protein